MLDAEKVGETLMSITPELPQTDNFQHWPPWRPLVVETARRVLGYTGGVLVMPMTVLVEEYWREISSGLAHHAIPIRHFVLHADQDTLRERIQGDTALGPSSFRRHHTCDARPSRSADCRCGQRSRGGRVMPDRPPPALVGRPR
ncbi:MAG: ATP/GTP-binding protein [uncultured Nocardioidaceae bacterium]|uniref:ATP/GTP-binding protein n=1 Tax=uncultured Nocardioidaceae bacterium TaxID=253824 RepID=A0A6J4LGJ5_9ACTN|nr:MAG: ATP/GTP-binding protein [uncultured Nocardioidaceae bacterium]